MYLTDNRLQFAVFLLRLIFGNTISVLFEERIIKLKILAKNDQHKSEHGKVEHIHQLFCIVKIFLSLI